MVYFIIDRILSRISWKTSFLFLSVSIFAFRSLSFADVLTDTAEDYHLLGYEEQQKGNLDKALTYYLKAEMLEGGNAPVFNDIGVTYEQLGVDNKAEEYYIKAIRNDPNYLPSYTNLAFLYQKHDETEKAIMFFRERYRLADQNDPWRARVVQELLRLDPSFREEFLQMVMEEASAEMKRQLQADLQMQIMRANSHYTRGMSFLNEHQYSEALEEFDRALVLTPNNPRLIKAREEALYGRRIQVIRQRFEKAVSEMETGHLESAKSIFQDILTIIPRKPVTKSE